MRRSNPGVWRRFYKAWCERLDQESIAPIDVFQVCQIHDRHCPSRSTQFYWSTIDEVRKHHIREQRHHDKYAQWFSSFDQDESGYKVIRANLRWMWENRHSSEVLSACIVLAMIEDYHRGLPWSRYGRPNVDLWKLSDISDAAYDVPPYVINWHHNAASIMPSSPVDLDRLDRRAPGKQHKSVPGIAAAFAEEFISVFRDYRAIVFEYGNQDDHHLRTLMADQDRRCSQRLEWKQYVEEQEKARRSTAKSQKPRPIRSRPSTPTTRSDLIVSRDELESLVWSKPTTAAARDLGISDVALGKRCKRAGVAKPPRGFWAKVKAGKVPHPNGVPVARIAFPEGLSN